jgi:exodeoxyribonuclease V beta subunit
VLDYKSNLLKGYAEPDLDAAMRHHHYLLQSRIYCVALHRHLSHHLEDYDPARHFGGVAYLFVRAMPDRGTWFHRPDPRAMEALDSLFPVTRA